MSWETINDQYRRLCFAQGNAVDVDDVIMGHRAFKEIGHQLVNPGKASPAVKDAVFAALDRLEGKVAPDPFSLMTVYINEPPASITDAKRIQNELAVRMQEPQTRRTKALWEFFPSEHHNDYVKLLQLYYVVGVLGGFIAVN